MSDPARPVRVLLLGRHFWPLGSIDSAGHLMELATGLHLAGLHVSVVTPKFSRSWSETFTFREFDVYRPFRIFRSGWTARGDRTASRYIRYVRDWIASNPVSCDVVYCDGGREEAVAAVEAARWTGCPSVVRIAGHGNCSDLDYFSQSRMGKRCRSSVMSADAVILGDARSQRRWIATGGNAERVQRIPIGIGPSLSVGLSSRKNLRRSMSQINGDLFVPDACSVILSVERMRRDSGLMTLVESAYSLSEKITGLQYWFIGDGPKRESILLRLKSDGLRQAISMPGSFGLMDDVFSAADLMVHVGAEGFEHQVPTAISAALPLIVANTEVARDFFSISEAEARREIIEKRTDAEHCPIAQTDSPGELVWWFDPTRPKTLRLAIDQIVSNLETARSRADRLRKLLQRVQSRSESIDCYTRLFRRLASGKQTTSQRTHSLENTQ